MLLFTSLSAFSQTAENIIIITTDGLRWQEVFAGMDSAIANNKKFNQGDSAEIFKKYWAYFSVQLFIFYFLFPALLSVIVDEYRQLSLHPMSATFSVFPTHVGMNRHSDYPVVGCCGVPHARGDEPLAWDRWRRGGQCSPRTWG